MKLKNVADVVFSFPNRDFGNVKSDEKWLTSQCLLENNEIGKIEKGLDWVIDESLRVHKDDIVMRRVRPQFVNYIDSNNDYLVGQNLALIRATELVYPKYLAYMLESHMSELYLEAGSVIPSIKRRDLEDIDIGKLPSMEMQEAIGELWWLQKEKNKKTKKLMILEEISLKVKLQELIENKEKLL